MNVLVIGANGNIGKLTCAILAEQGHSVKAMVRKEEQQEHFQHENVEAVLGDLEKDFQHAFKGIEAVIFTAGSGGHTGPEQTEAVDYEGAVKSIKLSEKNEIEQFIMVSSLGADTPEKGPESLQHYLEVKGKADKILMDSSLNYTILRPGALTDEDGMGMIMAKRKLNERGSIPRTDVARTIAACLGNEKVYHEVFELIEGEIPIKSALEDL
ncbi:SDR family oxidoreductase [Fictibacillus nanhaiensis]|uniref:SDR family oxidoreductase n=1 Tax=Fictibacillus nanhaiensis TaxID=742169 RepID=UPI001C94A222|nr:SDR family oxidoreductase [Fictibacillus nanhaiensis]